MDKEDSDVGPEVEDAVHPAMQLLLARMDTHPEEFRDRKWNHIYEPFKSHWNAAEKKLFKDKHREICMGQFHEQVMKKVVEEPPIPVANASMSNTLRASTVNHALNALNNSFGSVYGNLSQAQQKELVLQQAEFYRQYQHQEIGLGYGITKDPL